MKPVRTCEYIRSTDKYNCKTCIHGKLGCDHYKGIDGLCEYYANHELNMFGIKHNQDKQYLMFA